MDDGLRRLHEFERAEASRRLFRGLICLVLGALGVIAALPLAIIFRSLLPVVGGLLGLGLAVAGIGAAVSGWAGLRAARDDDEPLPRARVLRR